MTIEPGPALPDDQLLPAVAGGDEAAFRVLYRRHTPRLRMLVLRILGGDDADADDVVQEAWVRAVERLREYRGEAAFATWLNGIGIRVAWETLRQRYHSGAAPADEPAVDPPDSGERLDLEAALQRLPHEQRAVVVLHDVEGFGHDEIAASLGVAIGTSRSHLSRARRALRVMLASHERILK